MEGFKFQLGLFLVIAFVLLGLAPGALAEDIIPQDIKERFGQEPTIEEIQKAAIYYAEVHPEKISRWRKAASLTALFPEISVDYDKTIYGSVSSSSGNSAFAVGPYDWGISLKWDLADLIWNSAQTSIDVRSRLMVKLRNDILEEVNDLYYERRRLQAELILDPPSDISQKMLKELEIEELTAKIDGYTNGYLSEKLAQEKY